MAGKAEIASAIFPFGTQIFFLRLVAQTDAPPEDLQERRTGPDPGKGFPRAMGRTDAHVATTDTDRRSGHRQIDTVDPTLQFWFASPVEFP